MNNFLLLIAKTFSFSTSFNKSLVQVIAELQPCWHYYLVALLGAKMRFSFLCSSLFFAKTIQFVLVLCPVKIKPTLHDIVINWRCFVFDNL